MDDKCKKHNYLPNICSEEEQRRKSIKKITEEFLSKWQHRQTWLTSWHNHNKITTKMYNNQHSELSEDNYGIKETTPHQTCRRGRDLDWLVPHPHVVDKNLGGISQE